MSFSWSNQRLPGNWPGEVLELDLTNGGGCSFELHEPSVEFISSLTDAARQAPYDFAVYALKSFDTTAFISTLDPYLSSMPPVLCLSNGVDNEQALEKALGADRVIAGTVTSSVGRRELGNINLERLRGVGVADGHPLSLFLQEAMNNAGLNARVIRHAVDMKWSKMLTNLPANATAAILDMTAAEVFAHPGLFRLEMAMLREALAVMRAHAIRVVDLPGVSVRALSFGISLPEFLARPLLTKAIGGGRGGKMPSFHIDLHSGRGKSEVEFLNGAVVCYGQEREIPTPVNKGLTRILSALTRGERSLVEFTHQPESLLEELEDISD